MNLIKYNYSRFRAILLLALLVSDQSTLSAQSPSKSYEVISRVLRLPDSKLKADSILNVLGTIRKDSSAQVLFNEGFRLVDKFKYEEGRAHLLNAFGVFKRDFSQYPEALELHKGSLTLARRLRDVKTEISALNNLGVVYRRLDENSMALNYHLEALKLAESEKDAFNASVALNSIGNIHIALGNYRDAITYFRQALPIAQKAQNDLGIAMNLNNIGEAYELLHIMDSAKKLYEESLMYNRKMGNEKGIAICYNSLGSLLMKQDRPGKAIGLFQAALLLNQKLADKLFVAVSHNRLGDAYFALNQDKQAAFHYGQALQTSQAIGSKFEAQAANKGMMQLEERLGNYEKAFQYSKLYKDLADSIVIDNNNLHVRQVEAIYRSEKEASRIALLETKRRNDKIVMTGSLILFVLLFLSGILYYLRRRLLERNRSLQRELELRTQIATDLHDDMGSTLSSIHIFSELLRRQNNNSKDLLDKIEANARDTLEALDDIIWLVKPANDKFSNLGVHIREYAVPLFESKDIRFCIEFPDSICDLPLDMEHRRNIFLILKESVNNLVKYSCCTEACIKAEICGDSIHFTVRDNGKGFDPDIITNRNGLKNLKSRALQIGAPMTITSAPGMGTTISFTVKINEKSMAAKHGKARQLDVQR